MEQTLCLRGVNFKVKWKLTEFEPGRSATWEGRGPAHSYARTAYKLSDRDGDGTHFEYENEFKPPGGFLGKAASRVLVGGQPQKEANQSLQPAQGAAGEGLAVGLDGPPEQEHRPPGPALDVRVARDVLGVRHRLAQGLEQQAGSLERP